MRLAAMMTVLALALALALGLGAGPALGQDDVMKLKIGDAASLDRPQVIFKHTAHADQMTCANCHHQFDKFPMNTAEGDGAPCSDCHQAAAGPDNPVSLRDAFHKQCKSCHLALNDRGGNTPVSCGQCHVRGK